MARMIGIFRTNRKKLFICTGCPNYSLPSCRMIQIYSG
jgi:hypothetical protein